MTNPTLSYQRGNRGIILGTAFILIVLLALAITPVVVGEIAIRAHEHIREVTDPLDNQQDRIGPLMDQMEPSMLRYVISGDASYLTSFQRSGQDLRETLRVTRAMAGRLSPEAVQRVDDLEQAVLRWEDFANGVVLLRQQGRVEEAQSLVTSGTGAELMSVYWQKLAALHDYVQAVRDADYNGTDSALRFNVLLGISLGVLGILAGVLVTRLAKRASRLYREVQTERGRAADSADRERQRADELEAIIENMAEGVTITDRSGRILRLNRVARQIWGLPSSEQEYGNISEIARLGLRYPDDTTLPPEELPATRALRGETFSGVEAVYVRADGRRYHLRFGGGAVRDEQGEVALAIIVYHDITEIRELERQREEFISVVAHDLRNPLATITGFTQVLSRAQSAGGNEALEGKAIKTIAESAKRLHRMIADLLDASRIEARRLTLDEEEIDLAVFLREWIERATKITEGHLVSLRTKGSVWRVLADPGRLEQVLDNLLSNAAKYSYPDTEIVVEVEPGPSTVTVSVTDHGPCISHEDQQWIFSRFHRAESAKQDKVPGLGLGLYITKGLVEAQGGRIWVECGAGERTTFRFTLPVEFVGERGIPLSVGS